MYIQSTKFAVAVVMASTVLAAPIQAQDASNDVTAVLYAQLDIDTAAAINGGADVAELAVDALAEQGYRALEIRRTLFGRIRILAESAQDQREVVLSNTTGTVLRDRILLTNINAEAAGAANGSGNTSASGGANVGLEANAGGGVGVGLGGASVSVDAGVSAGGGLSLGQ